MISYPPVVCLFFLDLPGDFLGLGLLLGFLRFSLPGGHPHLKDLQGIQSHSPFRDVEAHLISLDFMAF